MTKTADEWIESFEIFKKYEATGGITAAEHDEVFAGPDPEVVSSEDLTRLEQLGWYASDVQNFQTFV